MRAPPPPPCPRRVYLAALGQDKKHVHVTLASLNNARAHSTPNTSPGRLDAGFGVGAAIGYEYGRHHRSYSDYDRGYGDFGGGGFSKGGGDIETGGRRPDRHGFRGE